MKSKNPVDRIRDLLPSLPESDIGLAKKFLDSRDFESLQLLVDSSIVRVIRGRARVNVKEEYLKANLEDMRSLKSEVDSYYIFLESLYENQESNMY